MIHIISVFSWKFWHSCPLGRLAYTLILSALNSGAWHRTTGGSFTERSSSCMMRTSRQYREVHLLVRCTEVRNNFLLTRSSTTREISGDALQGRRNRIFGNFPRNIFSAHDDFICMMRLYTALHTATAVRAGGDKQDSQPIRIWSLEFLLLSLQHLGIIRYILSTIYWRSRDAHIFSFFKCLGNNHGRVPHMAPRDSALFGDPLLIHGSCATCSSRAWQLSTSTMIYWAFIYCTILGPALDISDGGCISCSVARTTVVKMKPSFVNSDNGLLWDVYGFGCTLFCVYWRFILSYMSIQISQVFPLDLGIPGCPG